MAKQETSQKSKAQLAEEVVALRKELDKVKKSTTVIRASEIKEELNWLKVQESATVEALGEGLMRLDEHGGLVSLNAEGERMIGWTEAELYGAFMHDMIHSEKPNGTRRDRKESPILEALRTGEACRVEEDVFKRKDGGVVPVSYSCNPIKEGDDVVGAVLAFRDITERKEAERERIALEDQLRDAQKMDAVGRLAGGIAHEFNNLLAIIVGQSEYLRLRNAENQDLLDRLDRLIQAANRGSALTEQLQDLARPSRYEPKATNVNGILDEVVDMLSRTIKRTVELDCVLDAKLDSILADPAQIRMAFINLLLHVADTISEGGKITVSTRHVKLSGEDTAQYSWYFPAGRYVQISLQDSDSGKAADRLREIYSPFKNAKTPSMRTGLRLNSVFETVKQHRGHMVTTGARNKGNLLTIYFPVIEGDLAQVLGGQKAGKGKSKPGMKIMIVDDEPHVSEILELLLGELGFTTITASDGEEAVELFEEEQDNISLVILNMRMPVMGGPETFFRLQDINPDVRVVISSGFDRDEQVERLLKAGAVDFIQKPYSIHKLSKIMATLPK